MNNSVESAQKLVPLFPLPRVVLFPHAVMPFHLFEPRYRALARDIEQYDGRIGISVLKTGHDHSYFAQTAPVQETVCVGKVIASEKLSDGTHNILVRGAYRATIVDEVRKNPYRVAKVVPCCGAAVNGDAEIRTMGRRLRAAISAECGLEAATLEQWRRILASPLQLDVMTDLIASDFPASPELRYAFLAEASADARAHMLIRCLDTMRNVRRTKLRTQQNDAIAGN